MASHSCILRDYELSITQQPISASPQDAAFHPVPVCHLRPRDPVLSSPDDRLHSLLLYCTLEFAHPDASSSIIVEPLDALSGSTVVGPSFDHETQNRTAPGCCFIFRDLNIRAMEGSYRLKFTLFETIQGQMTVCGGIKSNVFRCYESGAQPDMSEGTASNQATVPFGLKPRVIRPPMIRRRYQPQRSTLNSQGLPELAGLATAIYRPEPRSQIRGSREASRTGSERTAATSDRRARVASSAHTRQTTLRQGVSASLPSLSETFTRNDDEPMEEVMSTGPFVQYRGHTGSQQAIIYTPRSHLPQAPSSRTSSSSRLSKKQSAPARLAGTPARPPNNPGHQVGGSRRDHLNSRERGPVLPALIRRQLSRQSSPALVSTISGAGSSGSRTAPPMSATDPFYSARATPFVRARNDSADPMTMLSPTTRSPLPARDVARSSESQTLHPAFLPQHDEGKNKMGIDNLLS